MSWQIELVLPQDNSAQNWQERGNDVKSYAVSEEDVLPRERRLLAHEIEPRGQAAANCVLRAV
jgi:hypothetical protein